VTKVQQIQEILGVEPDGKWGQKSQAAFTFLLQGITSHHGKASSFADPKDIDAFRRCKALGGTDEQCFRVGDNGIGCYGDDVSKGSGESVALPPETMEETWGSVENAKHKEVLVEANGRQIIAKVKDRMPHREHITNGAIIDLNPDTAEALGLHPPFMVDCSWEKV
jgi:hypothetical protein